ncbi:polysaccharide export protein [Henriciella mobilis]|uniref:Polysaccharide export protein n=2 Tax=Henriciella mobilis TaxID=2305467 RepID=A0A399R8B4_9PROT|nr:polysaccharide biosynthesis/export family protein [Henriciella mobilis]RIJ18334.1 polysaccharide export protein [Henriciella mobilis]RIJ24862.1 polysaccharide export protein [Henriciella mobilis]RIJ26914.1 polysaccharide export protein [Henriciella mobilis]
MMISCFRALCAVFLASVFLAACETAPVQADRNGTPDADVMTDRVVTEYRLSNADRLRVTVFGEPELSGEFVVDGQGFLSLPLIGDVNVEGMTVREFQRLAEERFGDGYLREPRVSAEVVNYRPFYILGEVARPGEYPYTNGLTVMNAIATAEGFTYRANKRFVLIKGAEVDEEIRVELKPTLKVQPGDTIRVVERFF